MLTYWQKMVSFTLRFFPVLFTVALLTNLQLLLQ